MISDEELKEIVRDAAHAHWEIEPEIAEIAQELLQRREAERKANSWDDAPSDATHRAVRREKYIYYNACEIAYMEDCNIRTDKLEERPK